MTAPVAPAGVTGVGAVSSVRLVRERHPGVRLGKLLESASVDWILPLRRLVVRDAYFVCVFLDGDLPGEWNVDLPEPHPGGTVQ